MTNDESSRGAIMTEPVRRLIEGANYAHLATLLPSGAPHSGKGGLLEALKSRPRLMGKGYVSVVASDGAFARSVRYWGINPCISTVSASRLTTEVP